MAPTPCLGVEVFRECFEADFAAGSLRWKVRPVHHFKDAVSARLWNAKHANKLAGGPHKEGYMAVTLTVLGKRSVVLAHRVLWELATGERPTSIDHINRCRTDNRIANLRAASWSDNNANRAALRSGLKGATFDKRTKRYVAQVQRNGKNHFLGRFKTEQEAHEAYMRGAKSVHGDFAAC